MKVVIHSDGNRYAGAAVAYDQAGAMLGERARLVADGTVPVCEYTGLILGLRLALDLGAAEVECWMDAELVQRHVTGEYRCKDVGLSFYLSQVKALMARFDVAEVKLFPKAGPKRKRRYLNVAADALASECVALGASIDRIHVETAR